MVRHSQFHSEKNLGKLKKQGARKELALPNQVEFLGIGDLVPDPRNPRTHTRAQIGAIAESLEAFGFNAPILIDNNKSSWAASRSRLWEAAYEIKVQAWHFR